MLSRNDRSPRGSQLLSLHNLPIADFSALENRTERHECTGHSFLPVVRTSVFSKTQWRNRNLVICNVLERGVLRTDTREDRLGHGTDYSGREPCTLPCVFPVLITCICISQFTVTRISASGKTMLCICAHHQIWRHNTGARFAVLDFPPGLGVGGGRCSLTGTQGCTTTGSCTISRSLPVAPSTVVFLPLTGKHLSTLGTRLSDGLVSQELCYSHGHGSQGMQDEHSLLPVACFKTSFWGPGWLSRVGI